MSEPIPFRERIVPALGGRYHDLGDHRNCQPAWYLGPLSLAGYRTAGRRFDRRSNAAVGSCRVFAPGVIHAGAGYKEIKISDLK